jgi:hypothetical protein
MKGGYFGLAYVRAHWRASAQATFSGDGAQLQQHSDDGGVIYCKNPLRAT